MNRTPIRRFRMSDELWRRFELATRPGSRSAAIRGFVRWYIGETDELPARPARPARATST